MDTSFYHISEKAVERVAETAALTVPGVRSVDSKLAGLAGRGYPRIDVHLDRATATAAVDAEIATAYPAPVAAITDAVRATLVAHIRTLCGLDVSRVKVTVANVEAYPAGTRVTWDDVASHTAGVVPTPVHVHPSQVVSPVTEEQRELDSIVVTSTSEHLRDVVVPAPPVVEHVETPDAPVVEHVETPEPVEPRTHGFLGPQRPLEPVSVPAERPVRVPMPPAERQLAPIQISRTEVRPARVPAPTALTPVSMEAPRPLIAPVVEHPTRVYQVPVPPHRPLREVTVERPPLRPVYVQRSTLDPIVVQRPPLEPIEIEPAAPLRSATPPPLAPVFHPVAPTPKPLKQITIRPVEKYYDRTR